VEGANPELWWRNSPLQLWPELPRQDFWRLDQWLHIKVIDPPFNLPSVATTWSCPFIYTLRYYKFLTESFLSVLQMISSVCPLVRTGSPHPLSRKRVSPPPPPPEVNGGGGGANSPVGELVGGGGSKFGRLVWRKSLALCLQCGGEWRKNSRLAKCWTLGRWDCLSLSFYNNYSTCMT
jgi:hypothetical protein